MITERGGGGGMEKEEGYWRESAWRGRGGEESHMPSLLCVLFSHCISFKMRIFHKKYAN